MVQPLISNSHRMPEHGVQQINNGDRENELHNVHNALDFTSRGVVKYTGSKHIEP